MTSTRNIATPSCLVPPVKDIKKFTRKIEKPRHERHELYVPYAKIFSTQNIQSSFVYKILIISYQENKYANSSFRLSSSMLVDSCKFFGFIVERAL